VPRTWRGARDARGRRPHDAATRPHDGRHGTGDAAPRNGARGRRTGTGTPHGGHDGPPHHMRHVGPPVIMVRRTSPRAPSKITAPYVRECAAGMARLGHNGHTEHRPHRAVQDLLTMFRHVNVMITVPACRGNGAICCGYIYREIPCGCCQFQCRIERHPIPLGGTVTAEPGG
jgi:hypothetical protein